VRKAGWSSSVERHFYFLPLSQPSHQPCHNTNTTSLHSTQLSALLHQKYTVTFSTFPQYYNNAAVEPHRSNLSPSSRATDQPPDIRSMQSPLIPLQPSLLAQNTLSREI